MDKKPFIKILQYLDDYYAGYEIMSDPFSLHFEDTFFAEQYLDIDEFFLYHTQSVGYDSRESLENQYGDIVEKLRITIIEVIYNIIYYSKIENRIKTKIANFLTRYNLLVNESDGYRTLAIDNEFPVLEGSFGKVFLLNPQFVKKQLKSEYWEAKDVASRFKNEYIIQDRMKSLHAQVLEVFDYNEINHTYLMQRADIDLADYMEENILSMKDKIRLCREILNTLRIAHDNGICHRDLHVGNVLILGGKAYVSDFGFAKDENHMRSRLSTVTPKPTHMYLAPEGFRDFTQLDYVSDVFSVGKIIDYILGNGKLGQDHPYKYIIEKATKNNRSDRYQSISEMQEAMENLTYSLEKGDDLEQNNRDIKQGKYSIVIENYLMQLVSSNKIASQVVANHWINLSNIILKCNNGNQQKIMNNIKDNFVEATGYGGWRNYDIFAKISYEIVLNAQVLEVKKLAYSILDGCAGYRYYAKDLLNSIPTEVEQILN